MRSNAVRSHVCSIEGKMIRRRRPSVVREFLRRKRVEKLGQILAVKRKCPPRAECVEKEEEEGGDSCVEVDNTDSSTEEQDDREKENGEDDEEEEEEDDEECEKEDEEKSHSQLLSAISGLGRVKRRGQRNEATPTVSQFQLSTKEGEVVKVGGLLKGVENRVNNVSTLRRQLATPSTHILLPPATAVQVEKSHRAVAYSSACREVGKWLPVVTHNRKAPHLSFPLQEEVVPSPSLSSLTETFQAVTPLEKAVEGVLGRSEAVVEATDAELTAAERAELVRVMGEEGRERVRESRRWRMLMSQYEAKYQREKRIKSRRFHKVQRKWRGKAGEKGEDEEEEGKGEKAERLRAKERMTLKHSRQSKWAREVLARGRKDPAARAALTEHSLRGRSLTHHLPPEESGSEEEEGEDKEDEGITTLLVANQANPWLLSTKPRDESTSEEQESHFDHSQQLIEEHSKTTPPSQMDDVTSCHQLDHISSCEQSNDITSCKKGIKPIIDPMAYLTPSNEVGGALRAASQQLLEVHEAFAGDDVVGGFEREKREEEEVGSKDIQLELPGWGAWGGEGVKEKRKKLESPQKTAAKKKPRSDREPGHVIIGRHGNSKLNKHLVKRLPWPYSTPQQFNRVQATPIGRQWNSEVVHWQMVTPRVERAVGAVIPPLKLTDDVREFMKNQDNKRAVQDRTTHAVQDRKKT